MLKPPAPVCDLENVLKQRKKAELMKFQDFLREWISEGMIMDGPSWWESFNVAQFLMRCCSELPR
jgi:hypothetical protein